MQEQHTTEWNYLDDAPIVTGELVAGYYGFWTNLYQVAHVGLPLGASAVIFCQNGTETSSYTDHVATYYRL